MDIQSYQNWFNQFTDQYTNLDTDSEFPLTIKKQHTQRVCEEILFLCHRLNVSEHAQKLAQIIALFHDLGRFEQYARYQTFNDSHSINHGIQGIRDLARNDVLANMPLKDRKIICNAIRYHNSAKIPINKDDETLFFIRLIRDADKLDIWRIFFEYYSTRDSHQSKIIELGVPDLPGYSENIINALLNGRIALISDLKTLNDFKLIQLGWIYDLNFYPSFERVKKQKIIENMAALLPKTSQVETLTHKLIDYRDRHLSSMDMI
ncbi:MAG: Metal-dependent phosphohydrolase [Candidatus Magnetoglobus multicellularis str. Araruama]|uniref:Metal-dependent phosphohydrolase n=1 Tax=Candidatus Magnetoglobus multicellularis str. Araruama TaxID=890399 RepID=A0A1V1PGZ4_9BACT|nr:MAG: Metal-dependent phosphohydrolase [Candidatus Magnetoglobus multicellularis str. Araruama]